jgi:hypothetical protein
MNSQKITKGEHGARRKRVSFKIGNGLNLEAMTKLRKRKTTLIERKK